MALFALDGLAHLRNKQLDVLTAINASASHGVLLYALRKVVSGLDSENGATHWPVTPGMLCLILCINLILILFSNCSTLPTGIRGLVVHICVLYHQLSDRRQHGHFCRSCSSLVAIALQQACSSAEGENLMSCYSLPYQITMAQMRNIYLTTLCSSRT